MEHLTPDERRSLGTGRSYEEKMLESGVGARSRAGSSHVNNRAGYDSGGIVRSTPRPWWGA